MQGEVRTASTRTPHGARAFRLCRRGAKPGRHVSDLAANRWPEPVAAARRLASRESDSVRHMLREPAGPACRLRERRPLRVVLLGCRRAACPAALSRSARGSCTSASASSARAASAVWAARDSAPLTASSRSCRAAATCSTAARSAWAARARGLGLLGAGLQPGPGLGQLRTSPKCCQVRLPGISLSPLAAPPEPDPGRPGSCGPATPPPCRASIWRRRNAVSAVCGSPVTGSGSPQYPGSATAPASPAAAHSHSPDTRI